MPLPGINITGLSSSATQVFTKKGPINFVQLKREPTPALAEPQFPHTTRFCG
jgi:hypothetical protein